jgi:1-acyl-sn-glycerol-3-phosphate acyltransferase
MTANCPEADPFGDIRPYRDHEVKVVIQRLLHTSEFIEALARFRFPKLSVWAGPLVKPLVRRVLARQLRDVDCIRKMQDVLAGYMGKMIERTTSSVTYSGLERLGTGKTYLFISNHRDIAMDPAFVNWVLHQNGKDTVRIAIGDNLLRKPYVSDLMRLNKSFIVKRSAKGVREKLAAYIELSSYIDHSITEGHSIWIAQREGRAKDGNDKTDPAIMKMLYLKKKKQGVSFPDAIRSLQIVPVAISYEYDPCDLRKVRELYERETTGRYEKSQYEDIQSIVEGITGNKGHVHVAFCEPLVDTFETPDQLAAEIDRAICQAYRLHGSNWLATEALGVLAEAPGAAAEVTVQQRQAFNERLNRVPIEHQHWFKTMYANPVINKQKLFQEAADE